MSANTDGVVMYCPKEMESIMDELTFGWMMTTDMMLERTSYKALASRDVNNYVAIKPDGKVKGKGIFAPPGLMKNPDRIIIYDAVSAFLAEVFAETFRALSLMNFSVRFLAMSSGYCSAGDFMK